MTALPCSCGRIPEVSEGGMYGTWHVVCDNCYDGAPDSHCPIGLGLSPQAAIDGWNEKVEWEMEV